VSEIEPPDVYTIQPQPGDTVVISYAVNLSQQQAHEVREKAEARFPECHVVVLDNSGHITVEPGGAQ
jgi:hypothetical protein